MDELKAERIIELEKERRQKIIYNRLGIDYPKSEINVAQEIQKLKEEIMIEDNLEFIEVEDRFKHEFLFSHKIAKAIDSIYALYQNEYDDLMLIAWKTLNSLKDLLYSRKLVEKGMEPFEINLEALTDDKLNEFKLIYENIMKHYAHAIAYKKLISLLKDILDTPLVNQLFTMDDFNVIDDIIIAAEGIETFLDNHRKYDPIVAFKNLRKIKNISLIRHDTIKRNIETTFDSIRQGKGNTYPEDESNINAVLNAGIVSIVESITEGIESHEQALSIVPKYTNFANSKEFKTVMGVSKKHNHPFNEPFDLSIGRGKKDISLEITLSYDGEPFYLDTYDSIIYSTIATLREVGNTFITIDMIYRKMNGFNGKQRASEPQKQELIGRIERMRTVKVTADYSPLAEFKKSDGDFVKDEEVPILFTWKRTQRINGVYSEGYVFPQVPIFYDTAKKIHHIQNIDDKFLNLGHEGISNQSRLSNSRDRTIINTYLIQRIEDMKSNNRLLKTISIDTVCEKLAQTKGLAELDRNAKKRAKDNIFAILDIQKENGLIIGYEGKNIGKSRGIDSVDIIV